MCAQKLDEDGVAQWADVEICDAVGDQQDPVLVTDGAGGAIIAWVDQRIDGGDIYAQKVDAGGSLLWGPLPRAVNGQPVCNIPGVQEDPVAVEDGNGGAFFAWEDSRSGSYDIYTQRMSNLGLADYADDGVALVAAPHDQRSIYASRGESGQALICWEDTRVDVFQDIFAQLISSAAPDVTSITPSSGQAGSTVSITDLAGTGFDTSGVSVVLKKSGEADIAATGETVVSSNRVTCDFDLTGAEPGVWDVYLENDMDGQGDTLAGAFTVTEPLPTTNTWCLAEGCTGAGFETWVLVQNPEATDVTVDLNFMTGSGPQNGPQDFRIAANSRHSFLVNDYVTDWDVSTKVVATGGEVICERAMYGAGRTWAHDSVGVTQTAPTWYLAEGCTGAGFETWVLVQNPEATDVTVDLTFMTGSGPQNGPQDFRIAANSRHSFLLNDYVTDWDVSTKVTSEGGNVICERAMYGNARTWAHDSIGHPSK